MTQLINVAARHINKGQSAFYKEALDLYKIGLKIGLIVENDRIQDLTFGNIVLLGCRAEDFIWVKAFIEDYQVFLDEAIRVDTVALNFGLWYFHQNDFEMAYSQFYNHSFSPTFQLKVRSNLNRIFFEQFLQDSSMFYLLLAQLNAFEKYLRRNEMFAFYKIEAYLNFIAILKKLATGIFDHKNLTKIKIEIMAQIEIKKRVIGKDWLLKKLDELVYPS